ncbi:MAG: hypothetical protein HYR57_06320 [Candidatus Koribacter versatilis]|nr:hypothetical protein [Candidatus Koribacter versatilis]
MLSRCLNPACGAPFRYLQDGRIFSIERAVAVPGDPEIQRLVEHYWLCGSCSMHLKVVVENGSVTTQPIHQELSAVELAHGGLIA